MQVNDDKMITIDKSCEIPSSVDRVWEIVSDTDKDETYWTALRDIKVLRKEGNTIEREANVGPRAFAQKQADPRAEPEDVD
jgi:hypothetical protein